MNVHDDDSTSQPPAPGHWGEPRVTGPTLTFDQPPPPVVDARRWVVQGTGSNRHARRAAEAQLRRAKT